MLTANSCSNWKHPRITSITYSSWSVLTKKCKVSILNPCRDLPTTVWRWVACFSGGGVRGLPSQQFPSQITLGKGLCSCTSVRTGRWTVVRVLLPAQAAGVVELSGMFLSVSRLSTSVSRSLNDPGVPRTWVPPVVPADELWSVLHDGCRSRLHAP